MTNYEANPDLQMGMTWGGGDSLDRERVRDIMNDYYGVAS